METKISGTVKEVIISPGHPTILIGERINPSGKKKLAESLKQRNLQPVIQEAIDQVKAGADVLDVNVTVFGLDDVSLLPETVRNIQEAVDVPLCIDSTNARAIEAALKVYRGKPLINSVSGEEKSLNAILPLVKEYGAAVIALPQDDNGIPKDASTRLAIAQKIIDRAEHAGIPREDIVIDCLALAIGAYPLSALTVLETINLIRSNLGANMTIGVSNISFGLPDRNTINSSFLAMIIAAGINCAVADVARVRPSVLAADLLTNKDKRARRYIQAFRQSQNI